jgi:hypothetical protein
MLGSRTGRQNVKCSESQRCKPVNQSVIRLAKRLQRAVGGIKDDGAIGARHDRGPALCGWAGECFTITIERPLKQIWPHLERSLEGTGKRYHPSRHKKARLTM